jgi:hypothetical protein
MKIFFSVLPAIVAKIRKLHPGDRLVDCHPGIFTNDNRNFAETISVYLRYQREKVLIFKIIH